MYVRTYVCTYVCMCVCVSVHTYVHMYISCLASSNVQSVYVCVVEKKRHGRMKRLGKAEDTVETHDTLVS